MRYNKRQSGISLTEILVVIGVMAILMSISIPAARGLIKSFESGTGVRHLIDAALSNARAIAVREQAYAGIRIQQDTEGSTYIIFIIHDKQATGQADGFCAVMGRKPMKLPEGVSVRWTSIVFSPSGKLTTQWVQCLKASADDTIFNNNGRSLFSHDGGPQQSKQSIQIQQNKNEDWTTEYINPYSGELVMQYREQKP